MDPEASNKLKLLEHMLDDPNAGPTDLPLSILTEITNNFSHDREVGTGGFAVVYKGRLPNGRTVAVKKLSDRNMDEKKFNQEVGCLMMARHKNIVRFLGYCADTQGKMWNHEGKLVMADARQRLLCFEFLPNGSLRRYIAGASQGLEWKRRYLLIKGVCQGLHYLHQNKIVHLDLKPENILLDYDMVPKIIDFGLSRHFKENQSQLITSNLWGTYGYLAPEYVLQKKEVIKLKLDIYSLGVIIVEILTGQREAFAIENLLNSWSNRLDASQGGERLEQVKLCTEIGLQCIKSNPEDRPTTECIIRKLDEMEKRCGFVETDICTSPVTQKKVVIKTGLQGVLPVSHSSHSTSKGASSIMPEPLTLVNTVGWAISPIISKLVKKGLSYLDVVSGSSDNNLRKLEEKIVHLNLMLENAQASPGNEKVERWLKKLKSAFYDAEDILDAIDYHRLLCKTLFHRQSVTKQKAITKNYFNVPSMSKRELRETLKWIEDLLNEGQKLLPYVHLTTKSTPEQPMASELHSKTTSKPAKVFGRDEDTKMIISMLHDTTADDHSVIGIHGIAGSGKTTLTQYVCDCEKKSEDHYFELIMWIYVTENFSVHTIYSEMLEIASGQKMDRLSNLEMLQNELKKILKSKRFLLVLDDVWYSESVVRQDDLKKLLYPLEEADKGSRILVTSRTADAAKLLGAQISLPISDMDEEEFFKMFMHYALEKSPVRDQDKSKFEKVGREISIILQKSPLAARTVAGQLRIRTRRAEDIGFWIDTLKRKRDLLNDTMGALWRSYQQLEDHVRQCFAYCSMFPRKYELRRDELVQMWMAQGFVDTSKNSDMEVAARECFEVLLSASFFQLKHTLAGEEHYTVPDLLHDLARRVAGSDCFTIEKDTVDHKIPQDVRHLFIDSDNLGDLMEQIVKLDTLRTLVMSNNSAISAQVFKRMLKHLKMLRFVRVRLEKFGANVIPECIGELKHLRYLGLIWYLSDGGIIDLPPAFTKLYHLQELSVPSEVRCLYSSHMADLENLWRINCHSMSIPHIGRMPWLQTLGNFKVKKEKGYEIMQLENLNNIHGELTIQGLGNIESTEDAHRANLSNKLHVSELYLDWEPNENKETGSSSSKKQKITDLEQQVVTPPMPEEILEALHPPALLEELTIKSYSGSTFPGWLSGEDDGKLNHLKLLFFGRCDGSGYQLKFGKTLPGLNKLEIERCSWNALPDNIEQLPSLKELIIYGCENIKSPPGLPSSLKKLRIVGCPNIKTLPELPPSLEELECEQYLFDSYPDRQTIGRIKIKIW